MVCLAVLLALPPVARFGRSAAQILQNGPRQLGLLGCAPCSPSGGPCWPLSSPNPPKRDLASLVCLAVLLALPLVGRFGLSAAQIFQNGPCSPSGGPFEPLSSPNPSKRTCPTLPLAVGAGQGRTFNLQVKGFALCRLSYTSLAGNDLKITGISRQDLTESNRRKQTARKRESRHRYNLCVQWWEAGEKVEGLCRCLSLVLRFCPLSGPNPPKRTSPAWSAGLCSLLSLWWSVLAAQQPKSSKTDLPCSSPTSLFSLPFSSSYSVLSAERPKILQNGPLQLGLLGCGPFWPLSSPNPPNGPRQLPCSPSGGPFWPLSSLNPSKRTSPAWSAWLCSLLSLWWSVLAAQQPKSFKTDLPNSSTSCGCRAGSNPRSSG